MQDNRHEFVRYSAAGSIQCRVGDSLPRPPSRSSGRCFAVELREAVVAGRSIQQSRNRRVAAFYESHQQRVRRSLMSRNRHTADSPEPTGVAPFQTASESQSRNRRVAAFLMSRINKLERTGIQQPITGVGSFVTNNESRVATAG